MGTHRIARQGGHARKPQTSAGSAATPARTTALNVLSDVRRRNAYAHEVLDATLAASHLSDEDAAFARTLVLGTVAVQGTLDVVIDACLSKPSDAEPRVRDALRLSAYELLFLKKEPHAAVSQGVSLVKALRPHAAGFANYALRRIAEQADAFPFGDPSCDTAALARSEGFPFWIAELLIDRLGRDAAAEFMRASNEPARLTWTVNRCLPSNDPVADFAAAGIELVETDVPGHSARVWRFADRRALGHPTVQTALDEQRIIMADTASMATVAFAMEGIAPTSILEIGAGRGTKTLLLQNALLAGGYPQAVLTSVDDKGFKVDMLKRRASTAGVRLDRSVSADARTLTDVMPNEGFDLVFVDAPCSGLGTLRRHPEIRWRLSENAIDELAVLQRDILCEAARLVNPGGRLAYATCTVTPQENEQVVAAFLQSDIGAAFDIVPMESIEARDGTSGIASEPSDGLFRTMCTVDGPDAHVCARFIRNRR